MAVLIRYLLAKLPAHRLVTPVPSCGGIVA